MSFEFLVFSYGFPFIQPIVDLWIPGSRHAFHHLRKRRRQGFHPAATISTIAGAEAPAYAIQLEFSNVGAVPNSTAKFLTQRRKGAKAQRFFLGHRKYPRFGWDDNFEIPENGCDGSG